MPNTLGYHLVKSCYGQWLPGDERGHWSSAWDEQIGYTDPGKLHPGDPVRKRMAAERMKHPPVVLSPEMIQVVADTLGEMIEKSEGSLSISAFAIEPTHMHLLLPYTGKDIDRTAQWIGDQTTKAIHRHTDHAGPVWCKGKWRTYVYELDYWRNITAYIQRHNTRRGLPADPYPWIKPVHL